MDSVQSIAERALANRRAAEAIQLAAIAKLPCEGCTLDSPDAMNCEYYDKVGCKHLTVLTARRAASERRSSRIANLARAGVAAKIDEEHGDAKLQMLLRDELEPWAAVHAVRRALETKSLRFLVLAGEHRTGKTLAMMYACALRTDAIYIAAQKLGRISQDTASWISAGLLCVNELGREHLGNGYTASNLEELMAEREYGRKLTIFTTNLPLRKRDPSDAAELPALADRYGDLFMSRLRSPIGAYVVCRAGVVDADPIPLPSANKNSRPFNERAEAD